MIIYVVKNGDSLYEISQIYGVSVDEISYVNMLETPDKLVIGQSLIIPIKSYTHIVQRGESIYGISRHYNVSIDDILKLNPNITNPGNILPGEVLNIPGDNKNRKTIDVNGYAYANISDSTLDSSLPYLTYIAPFSYQVQGDGSLTRLQDNNILSRAFSINTVPLLVITNIKSTGGFDSELAKTILTNQNIQNELLDNIETELETKGFGGINIDFEYIYPENREDYNSFLQRVADRFKPMGYLILTSLAPKTSKNQQGTLYEAHDYDFHGSVADKVIIMTYEWGYTYSSPMAVAPVNEVRKVLDYAVSAIPSIKILMGLSNYGYDWKIPYQKGVPARAISNLNALNLAVKNNSAINFDNVASAPYFNYVDNEGKQHVVWFEDARSYNERLKLISEYNLGGTSIWTINNLFRPLFEILESQYIVYKRN